MFHARFQSPCINFDRYIQFLPGGKGKAKNIQGMSPKSLKTKYHVELDISLYWLNFSKEVSQLMDWQTYKKFVIIWKYCTNNSGMSQKNLRYISHTEQEIFLYLSNFSKKISQLTHWQTHKKFRIIWNLCTNIQGMSPKDFRKISCPALLLARTLREAVQGVTLNDKSWHVRKVYHPDLEISL